MTHDFDECLRFSHGASDLPIWGQVYERAFGPCTLVDHRHDGEHQRAGIDRTVVLADARTLYVDEKVRRKAYVDILVEHVSNSRTGARGWACKAGMRADYIAYAILPLGMCYLLPVVQLQRAWARCGTDWRSRFGDRRAPNETYDTISTPVPVDVLFAAIGQRLRVAFDIPGSLAAAPPAPLTRATPGPVATFQPGLFDAPPE